jgi:DNA-binding PucR family transcriptional regulator
MRSALAWDRPTPRVAELIRTGAQLLLRAPEAIFAAVDAAVLAESAGPLKEDPVLSAAIRRNTHANLIHWAQANVDDPGGRVSPRLTPDALSVARDVVRRGLDTTALHGYRLGQNVGWQNWMELAFELTADPGELRELLAVSARSIFTFVDETLEALTEQIERERDELTRGTHARRLEVVSLILEGAPIEEARAASRLGYALDRPHTAVILWCESARADMTVLQRAADALASVLRVRPLSLVASASALWLWLPGATVEPAQAGEALAEFGEVRVALGPQAPGIAGFRRSHRDAVETQRVMAGAATPRLASYEQIQIVALTTQDEERVAEFVARTLGAFAAAAPELRETARTYLREGHNAARTARRMFTHRNTVLARLARMEELLPTPLEGHGLAVALALEILHWREGG